jgi:hypothetical protein
MDSGEAKREAAWLAYQILDMYERTSDDIIGDLIQENPNIEDAKKIRFAFRQLKTDLRKRSGK